MQAQVYTALQKNLQLGQAGGLKQPEPRDLFLSPSADGIGDKGVGNQVLLDADSLL